MNKANRLVHFTPLRYPGGKGKLAAFVKRVLEKNGLVDGEYCEPYAGGAGDLAGICNGVALAVDGGQRAGIG